MCLLGDTMKVTVVINKYEPTAYEPEVYHMSKKDTIQYLIDRMIENDDMSRSEARYVLNDTTYISSVEVI